MLDWMIDTLVTLLYGGLSGFETPSSIRPLIVLGLLSGNLNHAAGIPLHGILPLTHQVIIMGKLAK